MIVSHKIIYHFFVLLRLLVTEKLNVSDLGFGYEVGLLQLPVNLMSKTRHFKKQDYELGCITHISDQKSYIKTV